MEQYLRIRLESLLDLGAQVELRVLEGTMDEFVLPGFGGEHVRETSLTLHHLFGVPFIPASSLKGVVRNWSVQTFAHGNEEAMESGDTLPARYFQAIFGTQEGKSNVQFYDVFFEEGYEIVPDVLTVHFPNYYRGQQSADDRQSPNPVKFYAVRGKGARVVFSVDIESCKLDDLPEVMTHWITSALCELGIGSKTASGYGRFSSVRNVTGDVVDDWRTKKQQELELQAQVREDEERRRQEEALLASLNEGERLAYEIAQLSTDQLDSDRSKSVLFEQVQALSGGEQQVAASALKEYWEKTGDWKKPSKRQKEKNSIIRQILEV
jgi:CRISPR-associated protein Cmr6